jgi:hypothetical protein
MQPMLVRVPQVRDAFICLAIALGFKLAFAARLIQLARCSVGIDPPIKDSHVRPTDSSACQMDVLVL